MVPQISQALPVPAAILNSLDKIRSVKSSEERNKSIFTIVAAAVAKGNDATSPPAHYILRRLVNGVSVSSGLTRANYSAVLHVLCQVLAQSAQNVEEIVRFIKDVYQANGSFEVGYPGAERERALATIVCCAVIVNTAASKFTSSSARDVVSLLRLTVNGTASRWRLGPAALKILHKLVSNAEHDVKQSLVKPLWQWCEERKDTEDGFQLALELVLEHRLVGQKAFKILYPAASSFSKPLMATFDSGFSYLPEPNIDFRSGEATAPVLPQGWRLAIAYLFNFAGKSQWNLAEFWKSVVVEQVIKGSRSGEKKLVALHALIAAAGHVRDLESFNIIFEPSIASAISVLADKRRRTATDVAVRKGRIPANTSAQIASTLESLGDKVVDALSPSKSRSAEVSTSLLHSLLLWSARNNVASTVFPWKRMKEVLSRFSDSQVASLFSAAVDEFAQPQFEEESDNGLKVLRNPSTRSSTMRLIFDIASCHPSVSMDAVKVGLLYSVFDFKKGTEEESVGVEKIETYIPTKLETSYAGGLPQPVPEISQKAAAVCFRKLASFIGECPAKSNDERLSGMCFDFMKGIVQQDTVSLRTPALQSESSLKELQDVAHPIMEYLSAKVNSEKNGLLFKALQVVAEFLWLYSFHPYPDQDVNDGSKDFTDVYINFLRKVEACIKAIRQAKKSKKSAPKPDEETPEPIEQITHLLTELCGRESALFRQAAVRAMEALGPELDDRVVAVLFDVMEGYSDEIEDTDDDESDVEEMDVNNDDEEQESSGDEKEDSDGEKPSPKKNKDQELLEDKSSSEESEEEDATEMPKDNPDKNSDGEESESENEVDIDIDKEDPAVLAAFDKRLGAHMRLLQEEKKAVARTKRKASFKFVKASRILELIETIARVLRLRIERSGAKADVRTPIVFLDLQVRLYEFALGEDGDNLRYLKQVTSIVSKHMLLPVSLYQKNISDVDTVKQLCDRFFDTIRKCKSARSLTLAESSTMGKALNGLTRIVAEMSGSGHEQFVPQFKKLLTTAMGSTEHLLCANLFSSITRKTPQAQLLVPHLVKAIRSDEGSKRHRSLACNVLRQIVAGPEGTEIDMNAKVWKEANKLLKPFCFDKVQKGRWTMDAFTSIVHVAALAARGGYLGVKEDVFRQLTNRVTEFSGMKGTRASLMKIVNAARLATEKVDAIPSAGPDVEEEGATEKPKKKQKH